MSEEILYRVSVDDKATEKIKKIERSLTKLDKNKGLVALSKNFEQFAKNINQTAGAMQSAGLKAGVVVGLAVYKLKQFETQMNTMQSVSSLTAEQLSVFRKKAIELGASTQYTSTDVAELGVVFARMGYSVDKTMSLLEPALNMATAGGITLSESATLLGITLNAFKIPAENAVNVVDLLAKGANMSAMAINDFMDMVSKNGAVASNMNMTLQQTISLFGVLKDNGLESSIAANSLKNSMSMLNKENSEVNKSLKKIGLSQKELIKLPFEEKLIALKKGLDSVSNANERNGLLSKIVGTENSATMQVLIDNAEAYKKKMLQLADATGYADKTQKIMMQGLPGAYERFTSALEGTIFGLGEASSETQGLTAKLVSLFEIGTKVLDWFNALSPKTKDYISNILLLTAGLVALAVVLKIVAFTFTALAIAIPVLSAIATLLGGLVVAIQIVAGAITLLGVAFGVLSTAATPILATIIASVLVVGAVLWGVYKAFKAIKSMISPKEEAKPDNIEKELSPLTILKNFYMQSQNATPPKSPEGNININLQNGTEKQMSVEVLKQSGLKLGVQQ